MAVTTDTPVGKYAIRVRCPDGVLSPSGWLAVAVTVIG
jgi:hypothetical protein